VDRDDHRRAGSDIRGSPASEKGGGTVSQDAPARCIMGKGACTHLVSVPFTTKLSGGDISEVRGPTRLFSGHRTSTSDLSFGRGGLEREGGRINGREHQRSGRDRRGLGTGQRAGGEVGPPLNAQAPKFFRALWNAALSQRRGPILSGDVRGINTSRARPVRRSPPLSRT